MSANEKQVGGDHYRSQYQHWDWVTDWKVPYVLGCATKYITRLGKKNEDDGEKAVHYLEKAIDCDLTITAEQIPFLISTEAFITANKLNDDAAHMIRAIARNQLTSAIRFLRMMIDKQEPTSRYVDQ